MPQRPNYKRGDVVLVPSPNSDLRTAKARPAVIVQADNLNTGLPQVVVAMISSKSFRANHASRVVIALNSPEGQQSGLLNDSVIMTDNLATILETGVSRVIGSLAMQRTDSALRRTLGL